MLKTENLCKVYSIGEKEIYALKDVNVSVRKGEFITITGESGAGKTVLLKLLSTYEKADAGRIFFAGQDIMEMDLEQMVQIRRNEMTHLNQRQLLFDPFTIEESLLIPLYLLGREGDRHYMRILLSYLGLAEKGGQKIERLSEKEKRNVMFALHLMKKPQIIFADDLSLELEEAMVCQLAALLKELAKTYQKTVLMVTEHPVIIRESDYSLQLRHGRVQLRRAAV